MVKLFQETDTYRTGKDYYQPIKPIDAHLLASMVSELHLIQSERLSPSADINTEHENLAHINLSNQVCQETSNPSRATVENSCYLSAEELRKAQPKLSIGAEVTGYTLTVTQDQSDRLIFTLPALNLINEVDEDTRKTIIEKVHKLAFLDYKKKLTSENPEKQSLTPDQQEELNNSGFVCAVGLPGRRMRAKQSLIPGNYQVGQQEVGHFVAYCRTPGEQKMQQVDPRNIKIGQKNPQSQLNNTRCGAYTLVLTELLRLQMQAAEKAAAGDNNESTSKQTTTVNSDAYAKKALLILDVWQPKTPAEVDVLLSWLRSPELQALEKLTDVAAIKAARQNFIGKKIQEETTTIDTLKICFNSADVPDAVSTDPIENAKEKLQGQKRKTVIDHAEALFALAKEDPSIDALIALQATEQLLQNYNNHLKEEGEKKGPLPESSQRKTGDDWDEISEDEARSDNSSELEWENKINEPFDDTNHTPNPTLQDSLERYQAALIRVKAHGRHSLAHGMLAVLGVVMIAAGLGIAAGFSWTGVGLIAGLSLAAAGGVVLAPNCLPQFQDLCSRTRSQQQVMQQMSKEIQQQSGVKINSSKI